MQRIITVTANTAVDQVVELQSARCNSFRRDFFYPSGKGVNVARAVVALGREVVALGFVGRKSTNFFANFPSERLQFRLTEVEGVTRTNVTYIDLETGTARHEKDTGFVVTEDDIHSLERELCAILSAEDVVVFAGSLPPGAEAGTYYRLIERCHAAGARVILDSSGAEMRLGIRARPFMIKPNEDELEELVGASVRHDEAAIVSAALGLIEGGVRRVVVSRESKGVLVIDAGSREIWKATVSVRRPTVSRGSVGAGDALVAGLAVGLNENLMLPDTIRIAVACAAANLLTTGPGVCRPEDILALLPLVSVTKWVSGP